MSSQKAGTIAPLDIGIALLHSDGSVSIPRIGTVESTLEGLLCEGGTFDAEPGRLIVNYDSGSHFGMVYQNGKWSEHSRDFDSPDAAKALAQLAAALITGSALAGAALLLWFVVT